MNGSNQAAAVLVAILAASLLLWGPWAELYVLASDDLMMIGVDREIASGSWTRLLAPQGPHIIPLFRLLRLYFDKHFPERFHWLHGIVLAAHGASTALLFLLSRRFFATMEASAVAAALFTLHALGCEAVLVKSQSTYVIALTLELGALWWLSTPQRPRPWLACWCLLILVGVHSLAGAAAIPGILVAYYLLGRTELAGPSGNRRAWLACGVPLAAAILVWVQWGLPRVGSLDNIGHQPLGLHGVTVRAQEAVKGLFLHFGFLLWRRPASASMVLAGVGALVILLWLGRNRRLARWVLATLLVSAGPILLICALRTSLAYEGSRYVYGTFLAAAVAAGAVCDLILTAAAKRPALRAAFLLILLALAPAYYWVQRNTLHFRIALLQENASQRAFWMAWQSFFRTTAETASPGRPVRMPSLQLGRWSADELYRLTHPDGLPGIVALAPEHTHAADCQRFWLALREARLPPGPLAQVPVPQELSIVRGPHAASEGERAVCRVQD